MFHFAQVSPMLNSRNISTQGAPNSFAMHSCRKGGRIRKLIFPHTPRPVARTHPTTGLVLYSHSPVVVVSQLISAGHTTEKRV